jgi:hypothetical protein
MSWINYDIYKALVAWLFMLVSGLLLLFSFGDDGKASPLTFFYLFLILLLGLLLLITIIRHREIVSGIDLIAKEPPVMEEDYEAAIISNIDQRYINPAKEVEDFLQEILPLKEDEGGADFPERILRMLASKLEAVQGLMFIAEPGLDRYSKISDYAFYSDKPFPSFKKGETLPGQVAGNKQMVNIENLPEGYMTVLSGLGSSSPRHLIIFPLLYENETVAVIELASFKRFTEREEKFLEKVSLRLGEELGKSLKHYKVS